MTELKTILNKEQALRSRLQKTIENGKRTLLETHSKGYFEAKLSEMRRVWIEYEQIDQVINEYIIENPPKTTPKYILDETFSKLETDYCIYIGGLYDAIHHTTELTDSTLLLTQQTRTEQQQQQNVLPKIALPKYAGDYDSWRTFHDLYIAVVHNNTNLKDVQKLYYLKGSLHGDAEKLLRHTPITNEDYLPAWNKLKARYENKKILVHHQLKLLTSQPKLNTETAAGLKSLIDTTEECMQQLRSLQVDTSSWDVLLIYLIVQRLPFITLRLWEEHQGASQELPKYTDFNSFLDTRLKVLEAITDTLVHKSNQTKSISKPTTTTKTYHVVSSQKCSACNGDHFLQHCNKFQKMDIQSKRKLVTTNKHCYNCLSKRHSVTECSSRYRCLKCKKRHHTTLHEDAKANNLHPRNVEANNLHNNTDNEARQKRPVTSTNTDSSQVTQTYMNRERSYALLSTALVKVKAQSGKTQILRCLIDSGSECSFITQAACHKLQANCMPTLVVVTGLNKGSMSNLDKHTKLTLQSCGLNKTTFEENFLVINNITDNLPTRTISKESYHHLKKLELADPTYWKPGKIDALLGAKVYAKIVQEGIVQGTDTSPTAVKTIFGWILLGTAENRTHETHVKTFMATTNELEMQLRQFWETEEVSTDRILTKDEQLCQTIYKDTCIRLDTGRYQVKLPFVDNTIPILGKSRQQAIRRFENLQRQFSKTLNLKKNTKNV